MMTGLTLPFFFQGEEEAMFQEYRKELKVIFNNIGALVSLKKIYSCIRSEWICM